MEQKHISVLIDQVLETFGYLAEKKEVIFLDGTIGLAGHSAELGLKVKSQKSKVKIASQKLKIIGIDKDSAALKIAEEELSSLGIDHQLVNNAFENIKSILGNLNIEKVDGILLDLGVSSMQLDEAERGFSFQNDAPLDMRMDQNQKLTAANIINSYREEDLTRLFFGYGEEKFSRKIASLIIKQRKISPIRTTNDLVKIIKLAIPKKLHFQKTHPATNVFRALRMEVNQEVSKLESGIKDCVKVLKPGGRLAVITFHSIEDRIIKNTFRELADPCKCSKSLPMCTCGLKPIVKLITKKPIIASEEEIELNPRARSAKLRIVEKL